MNFIAYFVSKECLSLTFYYRKYLYKFRINHYISNYVYDYNPFNKDISAFMTILKFLFEKTP